MFPFAKSVQQVAALPFVARDRGLDVLLVTSRRDGRWLFPKGWPEGGRPFHAEAAREAHEEAGVIGPVHRAPVGHYTYRKAMPGGYAVRARVHVYPLLVREALDDWPERGERTRCWLALETAAGRVGDRSLARFIGRLARRSGGPLAEAAIRLADAPNEVKPVAC